MKNFGQLAEAKAKEMGIKVMTHYGNDYNKYSVFIPRVYHNNKHKAKIRVLKDSDTVKNCMKITFDNERYTKRQIENIVNSNINVIKVQLLGSCQTFLRCNDLTKVITGIIGRNGLPTAEAKAELNSYKTI